MSAVPPSSEPAEVRTCWVACIVESLDLVDRVLVQALGSLGPCLACLGIVRQAASEDYFQSDGVEAGLGVEIVGCVATVEGHHSPGNVVETVAVEMEATFDFVGRIHSCCQSAPGLLHPEKAQETSPFDLGV